MDAAAFRAVNRFAAHTGWMHWLFTTVARYGIVAFALALVAAWWTARAEGSVSGVSAAVWAGAGALIALGLAQVIGGAVDRARPYTAMPATHVLIGRTTDFSFPSDHATVAGAVAAGLVLAGTRRWLGPAAVVFAAVMAFSRVYVGVHYPGDVLAGLALGAAVAAAGTPLVRRVLVPIGERIARTPAAPLLVKPHTDRGRDASSSGRVERDDGRARNRGHAMLATSADPSRSE